jgi:predicted RNase H-like nuclease (RuvC/YqgF family)
MKSGKSFPHSEISKLIYGCGIPMMMASDKFPLPKTVEHISASLPSKLSWPRQSLTRNEKAEMTQPYAEIEKPWSNRHERDALAAAVFAYNKITPLLTRIRKKTRSRQARNYVAMNTILRGKSIDDGLKSFGESQQRL